MTDDELTALEKHARDTAHLMGHAAFLPAEVLALVAEVRKARVLLKDIAVRGGHSHWTWPLIDAVLGDGASRSAYRELYPDEE